MLTDEQKNNRLDTIKLAVKSVQHNDEHEPKVQELNFDSEIDRIDDYISGW